MRKNVKLSSWLGMGGGNSDYNSMMNTSRYMELQKFSESHIGGVLYNNFSLPTFINSIIQIWFHLGYFRNLVYQADPSVLEEVSKLNTLWTLWISSK